MMTNIEFILLAMMGNRLLNPHLLVGIIGVVAFLLGNICTGVIITYMEWQIHRDCYFDRHISIYYGRAY
jgi:hypothetical protein